MNPAITAALIAAQQSGEATDVIGKLTKAGATSLDQAVRFDTASEAEAKQRDDLIATGLVHRRGDGRLFVNQRAVAERNARIGYGLLVALLLSASIVASVVALALFT